MNNLNRYFLIGVLLLTFFSFTACEDELNLQPQQSLSTEESLGDIVGLETALQGAYNRMQDLNYYGRDFVVIPEAGGDNILLSLDNSNRFVANNYYTLTADNTAGAFWSDAYAVIALVNNILENIDLVEDGTQEQKDQLMGQALAIRALAHFDLVRLFAPPYAKGGGSQVGVPVVLKTEIGSPSRNTVEEVYQQVIADFTQAINLLNNDNAPFFISEMAAKALLSRVYLYKGENGQAEQLATDVISSGLFSLVPNDSYIASWGVDGSSEEIFTLRFLGPENRGANNLGSIYIPESYGDLRPTQDFFDLLDPADVRNQFIRSIDGDEYQYKFPGMFGFPGLASPRIIRLAEVILNRAEARAKTGNFAGAIEDMNLIRSRAGIEPLSPPDGEVLEEVLLERRRELCFEGQRTFDIFRNGEDLVRIECNLPQGNNCTVAYSSHLITYPIPTRELNANPNMTQNEGY